MKLAYRPELDGLRGISVLGVLFFHVKFDFFSGGYLGVDVFIVISGYLITSIIFEKLRIEKFSFLDFFLRRSQRLLPSYFIVLIISLLFSYFLLLPDDLLKFSKSLISSTFFISNFFFWLTSGYWEEGGFNPLLHTWSLSLEWQFYFFLSIFLFFIWKISQKTSRVLLFLALIFIVSFSLAILFIDRNLSFFLLPFRMYEFLIGCFIYFIKDNEFKIISLYSNFLSFLAISSILISFVLFDSLSQVPGYISLIPCLGTAILIYIKESFIHKFLRLKYLVFVGLFSYSLYLFHWPIIVFFDSMTIFEINNYDKILLVLFSIVVSIINYFLIEKPFRKNFLITKKIKMYLYSLVPLTIIMISIIIIFNGGYSSRISEKKHFLIEGIKSKENNLRTEFLKKNSDLKYLSTNNKKVLIIGDSLAEDMFIALKQNLDQNKFDIQFFRFSHWCFERNKIINLFSFFEKIKNRSNFCEQEKKFFDHNRDVIKQFDYIILSSNWHNNFLNYIEDVVNFIKQYGDGKIIISSRNVMFPDIPNLVKNIDAKDLENLNKIAYKVKYKSSYIYNKKLKKLVNSLNLKYLDKTSLVCSDKQETCNVYDKKNKRLNIFDNHHWSFSGAKIFGSLINLSNL